ncbi:uncharacterized protein Z520_03799 [Fonsecaea multimorphosa CBS 102226]|uniref:Uncharacterized protein n=1 Tax=Fonsecaea multimorphosa CBS 102226 TaxID=1442371 RepID=A0A0D2KTL5_9EURO|nr:uncharacterized protein Z520_03799 [Fonsecaea multimorphosa CBS 102226]KIY00114.1 hypothetical protein Z520_03799 [Fonsecaea multimorphosa CBS 102226]
MPPIPPSAQRRGPTWIDKMKMGMLMGGTVGGIMGFIYGTVTIFQYGAGQAGVMRTLGKYMLGSGSSSWESEASFEQIPLRWHHQYGRDHDIHLLFTPDEIDCRSIPDDLTPGLMERRERKRIATTHCTYPSRRELALEKLIDHGRERYP